MVGVGQPTPKLFRAGDGFEYQKEMDSNCGDPISAAATNVGTLMGGAGIWLKFLYKGLHTSAVHQHVPKAVGHLAQALDAYRFALMPNLITYALQTFQASYPPYIYYLKGASYMLNPKVPKHMQHKFRIYHSSKFL
ncbi:hypothetical protein HUJ04_012582 [Dendroctonus ponderosae]|nr:hypothetical protein HUJ04_012582 [Dendroctonus ponderosae]